MRPHNLRRLLVTVLLSVLLGFGAAYVSGCRTPATGPRICQLCRHNNGTTCLTHTTEDKCRETCGSDWVCLPQ